MFRALTRGESRFKRKNSVKPMVGVETLLLLNQNIIPMNVISKNIQSPRRDRPFTNKHEESYQIWVRYSLESKGKEW